MYKVHDQAAWEMKYMPLTLTFGEMMHYDEDGDVFDVVRIFLSKNLNLCTEDEFRNNFPVR